MQSPSYSLGHVYCQWWTTTINWISQHVVDSKTDSCKIWVSIIPRCLRTGLGYNFYASLLLATMTLASVHKWCQTQSISPKLTTTVLTGAASSWGLMSPNSAPKISIIIPALQQQTRYCHWQTRVAQHASIDLCYTAKSPCPQKINVPALLCNGCVA